MGKTVGERIKELREKQKMTQEEFADEIGYARTIMYKWERGQCKPNAEALVIICKTFKVSADWLLGLKGAKK